MRGRFATKVARLVFAALALPLAACSDAGTPGGEGESAGVDPAGSTAGGDGGVPDGAGLESDVIVVGETPDYAGDPAQPGPDSEGSTDPAGPDSVSADPDSGAPADGAPSDAGTTAGKGFGEPCLAGSECESGFCVDGPDGGLCSTTCIADCPSGFDCAEVSQTGDPVFICVSVTARLCNPCAADGDCNDAGGTAHRCVSQGELGSFCGVACGLDGSCPDGYACQGSDDGLPPQCVPLSGACECSGSAKKLGLATACAVSNVEGTCEGVRICGPEGLSACSAAVPAAEICNGADDDCDGAADEGLAGEPCELVNEHGTCPAETACEGGESVCTGVPAAPDACNGIDEDCDGTADEGFEDTDQDGFADCVDPDDDGDEVPDTLDCANLESGVFPGALEICNGQDDDCDGEVDEEGAFGCKDTWRDVDGDGFGTGKAPVLCLCAPLPEIWYTAAVGEDCNDLDLFVKPNGTEVCNEIDDDCDGETDEGTDADFDGDGILDCVDPDDDADGWKDVADCKPFDLAIHPEAEEICDGADNDCNGIADDPGAKGCIDYWRDADGDGEGAKGTDPLCLCAPNAETFFTADDDTDCDDLDAKVKPGAGELCNGKDDDCDGFTDEGATGDADKDGSNDCVDADDDGDGSPDEVDCKPLDATVFPGAVEICNGFDDDCDTKVDEAGAKGCTFYWQDGDGDGWGRFPPEAKCLCAPDPTGLYVAKTPGDCKDADPGVYPGAYEGCNGVDDDCDGETDEGVSSPCGDCTATCIMDIGQGTDDPYEPEEENSGGIESTPEGGITLTAQNFSFPFIWIANSAEGTVSRLNTETGCEVAKYAVCDNPSRTAVDLDGNGIVACRGDGRVVKIAVLAAECPDVNGNGLTDTSTDVNGNCDIAANEMVAADECVLWSVQPDGAGSTGKGCGGPVGCARAAGVDDGNNVWVGMWNSRRVVQLDGKTGAAIAQFPITGRPYGLAIDADRVIWVASRDPQILMKVDPFVGEQGFWGHPSGVVYGLAIDGLGKVWVAGGEARTVSRFDPDTNTWMTFGPLAPGNSRGVAARVVNNPDGTLKSSWVFVAHHNWGSGCAANGEHRTVSVVDAISLQQRPSLDLGADRAPVGVAVDSAGMVWSVNQCESTATRLDPDAGKVLGTWPVGLSPYTYSDMTGYALKTITTSQGFYTHVFEGWKGVPTLWDQVWIKAELPGDGLTWITVQYRTADTKAGLASQPWKGPLGPFPPAAFPASLDTVANFLELKLTLGTEVNELKPVLKSLSVIAYEAD